MPPLGQAMVEGRRPPARCRSWIAVGPAEFMFSPRRWVSDDSHMNALWVRRGKQNMAERVRKKKGELPLHSGWAGPGATFSGVSLSGLSHNDCRRRLLTNRSAVRILFGEPNHFCPPEVAHFQADPVLPTPFCPRSLCPSIWQKCFSVSSQA